MRRAALLLLAAAEIAAAATLRLKVIEDHTGGPINGAEIQLGLVGRHELIADLETDAQGRFQATKLAAGDYAITVIRRDHLNRTLRVHIAEADFDTTVRLVRCAAMAGTVTSQDGALELARVMAMPRPAMGGPVERPRDMRYMGHPDARGEYRIFNLPPGEYFLAIDWGKPGTGGNSKVFQFYPDNVHPQSIAVLGGDERRNLNFNLSQGSVAQIKGTVQLPDPAAHYALSLVLVEQPEWAAAETQTADDGSFRLTGIAPGTYEILGTQGGRGGRGGTRPIDKPTYVRARVTVAGSNIEGLSLVPQKALSVSFKLQPAGESGRCPATAALEVNALESWFMPVERKATIGVDKAATLDQLPPGHFKLALSGLGESCYGAATTLLDLSGGVSPGVVPLPITPAGAIRGKAPAGDSTVVLWPVDPTADAAIETAVPGKDLEFQFTGLRPGRYRIGVVPAAAASAPKRVFDPARMTEVDVSGGLTLDVDLAAKPGGMERLR